jgi:HPt (histidine-containing phosphotransfer) domain-containing protein
VTSTVRLPEDAGDVPLVPAFATPHRESCSSQAPWNESWKASPGRNGRSTTFFIPLRDTWYLDEASMEPVGDLLAEYAAALTHRVDAIFETIQQARAADWATPDRERVRQLAHQLGGSALTYGYHEIGHAVRRVERLVSSSSVGEPAFDSLLEIALGHLRAATQHAAGAPVPAGPPVPLGRRVPEGRQPVVMLVDDDEAQTALLAKRLRALGFAAHGFSSRDEALAAVATLQPQVLLLDVMFPGMDDAGFDLSR